MATPAVAAKRRRRWSATMNPASRKPAVAPRTPRAASRKRPDSSVAAAAKRRRRWSAKTKPAFPVGEEAPLWDFSEELCEKKVRARLSSPCDVAAEEQWPSLKRAAWGVTLAGLPEPGEGRVRCLVDTFERLLCRVDQDAQSRGGAGTREMMKRAASAPSSPRKADEMDMASYPSVASSEISYCVADLPRRNRSSSGSARDERQLRRCNSIGSSERSWSRKVTRQHPFNLRTENLAKPPTKEPTEPSEAWFDHLTAEHNIFMEGMEQEKERLQKMDEEIEIKQLRKEQVPKARPMPDFSRTFLPKRSVKPHTVPREPRFHTRPTRQSSKTRS